MWKGSRPKLVTIKSKREIELMRQVCKVVALTYEELEKNIKRVVKSPSYLATTCRTSKKILKTSKFWSETFQL